MKKKPISTDIFTFEELISNTALYVDKTQYFHRLVTNGGKCYFCSRPRRFGKSLAVSIFKNIFLGNRKLFKGLYIDKTDYDWENFPVVHLDMARISVNSAEELTNSLHKKLHEIAENYSVKLEKMNAPSEFDSLISALKNKFKKNVVILIDEYDRPLTENLDDAEELEKVRRALSDFYQMIKGNEPNERFVFMTGVTRFSKVSIFSKLNNLTDISMTRDYGEMFGYTQKELEENFAPYIDEHVTQNELDRTEFVAQIKHWYNGFKFDYEAETVYNPVSVGQFFVNDCRFQNYWYATATPTFITKLAKKKFLTQADIDDEILSNDSLAAFDIADIATGNFSKHTLISLLFQTGYLTMGKLIEGILPPAFTMRFPNYEVAHSFDKILFEAFSGVKGDEASSYVVKIQRAANEGKIERLIEIFKNLLASVPYTIQKPSEKYYQSLIFCILKMCGMNIDAENTTNKGRIDAVLDTPKYIYLFEFKLDRTADEAVEQISQREYFQKFIEEAKEKEKRMRGLGISFSSKERNIVDWKSIW